MKCGIHRHWVGTSDSNQHFKFVSTVVGLNWYDNNGTRFYYWYRFQLQFQLAKSKKEPISDWNTEFTEFLYFQISSRATVTLSFCLKRVRKLCLRFGFHSRSNQKVFSRHRHRFRYFNIFEIDKNYYFCEILQFVFRYLHLLLYLIPLT